MDKRIEKSILHISNNFRRELLLDDIAAEVYLSKFHFQKLFKKETGLSPLQYLNKIRLEHAAHFLIMYPKCKQIDVAFECGYSSPSVFTRSFTQFYKTPPSEYQKNNTSQRESKRKTEQFKLPLTYIGKQELIVFPTNLIEENLGKAYEKIIFGINKPATAYGIYIDVPVHKAANECRYYAGIEKNADVFLNADYSFTIDEGYYTFFDVIGDFQITSKALIEYKKNYIDPSPYIVSSLVGLEKFKLPAKDGGFDYFTVQRTIYIKVRRK